MGRFDLTDRQWARVAPHLPPEQPRAILHQSPRAFGQARSTWTLALLARVAHAQGLSATVLSVSGL